MNQDIHIDICLKAYYMGNLDIAFFDLLLNVKEILDKQASRINKTSRQTEKAKKQRNNSEEIFLDLDLNLE